MIKYSSSFHKKCIKSENEMHVVIKHVMVLRADFSNKRMRNQRPEDLDVPVALADFIHQLRTQECMEDM